MTGKDRVEQAGRQMWSERQRRRDYVNLEGALRPTDVDDAYAMQDVFHGKAIPVHGPIAGWKIATTTKVMQQLMGIDGPCAAAVFQKTIHHSPARLRHADLVSLKIECELAFRLAADLPAKGAPHTEESVLAAVEAMMPAFELVDDRNAVYKETQALSLIADNCWNGGIVIGAPVKPPSRAEIDAATGVLTISGRPPVQGKADGPLRALAWVANLVNKRGKTIRAGMVVITGSVIATTPIAPGESAVFSVAGIGEARLETY
jgi:2-keto-4-pentenoate hydratase